MIQDTKLPIVPYTPNGSMFGFKKSGVFIELKNIVKIGEDVILVNIGLPRKQGKKGGFNPTMPPPDRQSDCNCNPRRNFEEYE